MQKIKFILMLIPYNESSKLSCRNCGAEYIMKFLDLGLMPLANNLLRSKDEEVEKFPLALAFCGECYLVQLTYIVPPEKLFREYLYLSSMSKTVVEHAKELAYKLIKLKNLSQNSFVVEIGSNDGYLLQFFVKEKIPSLGIEPAKNVAEISRKKGIDTIEDFFSVELAEKLSERKKADLIIANNVFAHIPDIDGTVRGIEKLLKDDGIFVAEFPYVRDMIEKNEFDTIYHEHVYYFSLSALDMIFSRRGLLLFDVERLPIHGGSLRIFVGRKGVFEKSQKLLSMLEEEEKAGMKAISFYSDFKDRVEKIKEELFNFLFDLKKKGRKVAGYGASAKATILLNFCEITDDMVSFVADKNPLKRGRFIPGVGIPVRSPDMIKEFKPDFVLLLIWNIKDEVMYDYRWYIEDGGRFIIPIPSLKVEPQL